MNLYQTILGIVSNADYTFVTQCDKECAIAIVEEAFTHPMRQLHTSLCNILFYLHTKDEYDAIMSDPRMLQYSKYCNRFKSSAPVKKARGLVNKLFPCGRDLRF